MNENKILVLDIETTGFLKQGGSIVEVGIVDLDLDTGKIEEVFSSLVRETILTAKHREEPFGWIFKNSDLTVEAVRNAPPASEVFPQVQTALDAYPLGCTAFNKYFDFSYLKNRGLKFKELDCPMALSRKIVNAKDKNGRRKAPSVEDAYNFFFPDNDYKEKHRGPDDAKHEAEIVYALYKMGVFKVE